MTSENECYLLASDAEIIAKQYLNRQSTKANAKFANARGVRNFFERIVQTQAERLSLMERTERQALSNDEFKTLTRDDVNNAVK